jgi:dephospho-CoA kinase
VVRVALTGGIASGKSHVLDAFRARHVPTIDADLLAHDVAGPGTPGAAAILARFGSAVLAPNGELDRRKLGAVVFVDPELRRALEAIVHPAVYEAIARWLAGLPSETPLAVADIPLLYETGHQRDFDAVVVAACPPEEQLRRVIARDHLSEAEARARLGAQWPLTEKVRRADFVIWTTGTAEETGTEVERVIGELLHR